MPDNAPVKKSSDKLEDTWGEFPGGIRAEIVAQHYLVTEQGDRCACGKPVRAWDKGLLLHRIRQANRLLKRKPAPDQTPGDLVGELKINIAYDFKAPLTALAAEITSAYNDGLRAGYDVDNITLQGVSVSHGGVSLVFIAEIVGDRTSPTPEEPEDDPRAGQDFDWPGDES